MDNDKLKSIKSRMGWQVGLKAATLFAVGPLFYIIQVNRALSEM
jgi:hypothetical protein